MQLSSSLFSKHHLNKYVSPKLLSTNDFAFVMYKQKLKEPKAGNRRQFMGNEPYMQTQELSGYFIKSNVSRLENFQDLFI
jgi:hypothetical protein